MFKFFLLSVFIISLVTATTIAPTIYEQDDFGDISLSEFTYSISVDCTAATIAVIVMNESNKPVQNASTYLSYIDFSTPLISSDKTDKDGFKQHKLPGDVRLMRGIFILLIQKSGYRNKEVHFDISGCYSNATQRTQSGPLIRTNNTMSVIQNNSNGSVVQNISNHTNLTNLSNSNNSVNDSNNNNAGGSPSSQPKICPLAFFIPLILLFLKESTRNK